MTGRPRSPRPKRWIVPAVIVAVALFFWFARPAEIPLRDRLDRFAAEEGLNGGVLAYGEAGGTPRVVAFGQHAQGGLMGIDERFGWAALARPITAAAALKLVQDGFVTLDSRINTGDSAVPLREILRGGAEPDSACPAIGYCALGPVIESAAGQSYASYAQQNVLEPRGSTLIFADQSGGWSGTVRAYWQFAAGPLDWQMRARPAGVPDGQAYEGLGWRIWPDGTISQSGTAQGAYAVVLRQHQRVLVAAFSGNPNNEGAAFAKMRRMFDNME